MKKIIVSIICVLFATSTFAQFVGASTMSQGGSTKSVKTEIAKQEISIHAGVGIGVSDYSDGPMGFSAGIKYKYKPFKNSNIRLLGEIGSEFVIHSDYSDPFSVLPILVGVNYEHRFNQNWSVFFDLGLGPNIPLSGIREYDEYYDGGSYHYESGIYQIGYTLSSEIGFAYDNFLFSVKGSFSWNDYTRGSRHNFYFNGNYYFEGAGSYNESKLSTYFLFRLGYRF